MAAELAAAGRAVVLFAVTNVDDLLVLAVLLGRAAGTPGGAARVVAGQYAGFVVLLAVCGAAALGATLLPDAAAPYLGLVPLALGLRAAWALRRGAGPDDEAPAGRGAPGLVAVAGITVANGGDNVGVYVPVLATAGAGEVAVTVVTFLVLVGAWCAAAAALVRHRSVGALLARWGDVLLPVVLVLLGVAILVEGGALGL